MTPQTLFRDSLTNFGDNDFSQFVTAFLIYLLLPRMRTILSYLSFGVVCILSLLSLFSMAAQLLTQSARHDSKLKCSPSFRHRPGGGRAEGRVVIARLLSRLTSFSWYIRASLPSLDVYFHLPFVLLDSLFSLKSSIEAELALQTFVKNLGCQTLEFRPQSYSLFRCTQQLSE